MNPLFRNASKALKAAARAEFRSTRFGKMLAAAESEILRKGRARGYMKRVAAKMRSRLTPEQLGALGQTSSLAGPSARYAKRQSDKKIMDAVYHALGPLGDLLSAFMRPMGKAIAGSLSRELEGAANFLRMFGYGVVAPPSQRAGKKDQIRAVTEMAEKLGFKLQPIGTATGKPVSMPGAPARPQGTGFPIKGAPAVPQYNPLPGWAQRAQQRQAAPQKPNQPPRQQRKTIDVDFGGGGKTRRIKIDDPILTGEMIPVVSSNVHSIGFDINQHHPGIGTLKVRFLQTQGAAGNGRVAGPLYFYYNVPSDVFRRFQKAASKGKFVWDNLRIRGSISGHRFDYSLQGISRGHVPRKATSNHEGYIYQKRTLLGEHFKTGEKRLFHSKETAFVRPFNGRPENGRPGNGRPRGPNRGRP